MSNEETLEYILNSKYKETIKERLEDCEKNEVKQMAFNTGVDFLFIDCDFLRKYFNSVDN